MGLGTCYATAGDALISYYAGSGFKADGYFCSYSSATQKCSTNAVVFDGTGLKPYTYTVSKDSVCTGGTLVDYTGSGMKPLSQGDDICGAV